MNTDDELDNRTKIQSTYLKCKKNDYCVMLSHCFNDSRLTQRTASDNHDYEMYEHRQRKESSKTTELCVSVLNQYKSTLITNGFSIKKTTLTNTHLYASEFWHYINVTQ